jgi:hypothetical protein
MKVKRTQGETNMLWVDYFIEQTGSDFKVKGDTDTEVMDKGLYQEGDIFVVDKNGWLRKVATKEEHYDGMLG